MSEFSDRLERDLGHIADRATPSSDAWEAIQTRIENNADQTELEITMLKPNPSPDHSGRAKILAAAAAVIVVVLGAFALFDDRSNETETIDSPTTSVSPTTLAAPATTDASAVETEDAAAANAAAANVALAEAFIAARNAYDGEATRTLLTDDAGVRDDLLRDVNGNFLDFDQIDFVSLADFDRVTGVQLSDQVCTPGSPGRVRCTYTWSNAWSRALGDDRYVGNSFVFDVDEAGITGLTNTFAQGPVDGFVDHISEVMPRWVQANHPEDFSSMFAPSGLTRSTAESLALWETYTAEFVASLE